MPGTQRPCVLPPAISISSCLHDFYMITPRVGHQRITEASHGSSCSLARPQQSPPPGRQQLNFARRRRRKPANQPPHITVCAVGSWPAADCREPATAACAAPDKVLLARMLSNSTHPTTAPPSAQATMTAIPSTYARRCYCSCAGLSIMVQCSSTAPPRSSAVAYRSLQCAQQRLLAAEPLNGVQIDPYRA